MVLLHEQLRRLKNTVMGAGNRLSLMAQSSEVTREQAQTLAQCAAELSAVAQRLERVLAVLRGRRGAAEP